MSLILDALRKLERERDAREPGVLVVGSVPWGESSRGRRLLLAGGVALVLAVAVGVGWLLGRPGSGDRPSAVAGPAGTPAPKPSAIPAPAPAVAPVSEPPATPALETVLETAHAAAGRAARPKPTTPSATAGAAPELTPAPAPPPIRLSQPLPGSLSGVRPADPTPTPPPTAAPPTANAESAPRTAQPGSLQLQAISQRDGRPVALINDHLVFEGDSFDGVRVLHIRDAEVEVEVDGQRRVLRF